MRLSLVQMMATIDITLTAIMGWSMEGRLDIADSRVLSLLLGLILTLGTSCQGNQSEIAPSLYEREVTGNVFDTTPVRGALRPKRLRRSGFEYKCSECHADLENLDSRHQNHPLGEHKNKVFDHGQNLFCLNCHHPDNRDVYVDHDGSEIPEDNPTRLCAKCHGPHHREWEHGVHGRRNGHWDPNLGPQTRLKCIRCHDPHKPRFQLMKPDAAPPRSRLDVAGPDPEERKAH
ncbi:hypothetical protein ACFL1X_10735 [Candidatus Hydrogenedentota bacterium]